MENYYIKRRTFARVFYFVENFNSYLQALYKENESAESLLGETVSVEKYKNNQEKK
jgi:hypothetical protein